MGSSGSRQADKPHTNTDARWNDIKTEQFSSTIPHIKNLSEDAKQLIASLNIPSATETQSDFNVNQVLDRINNGLNNDDRQIFQKIMNEMSSEDGTSATSPFISSEMYNNLVNSKTSSDEPTRQTGGKIKRNLKGGMDDSDTSSTDSDLDDLLDSSDSDLDSDDSPKKKHNKPQHNKPQHNKQQNRPQSSEQSSDQSSESQLSGGSDLSYLSSSAHSDNNNSSLSDDSGRSSISVNTSDINMVSDY
jgi:hypothetical protein